MASDDVLAMAYEHMVEDPAAAVRRVADLIGVADVSALAVAIHNSSRPVMADPLMGLPQSSDAIAEI